jgi:glycosyltransferase involved in cell wall biosynthesis
VGQCNVNSSYGRELAAQLLSLPNVTWHGYVPHNEMSAFYHRAAALLCTSESEGFPNIFLEAWASNKPVVSTIDPDGVIERHGLGRTCSDYDSLRECVRALFSHSEEWHRYGRNAREYVREHHSTSASVASLERIFSGLLDPSGASSVLAAADFD